MQKYCIESAKKLLPYVDVLKLIPLSLTIDGINQSVSLDTVSNYI